jgi:hypothetical protein
MAQKKKGDQHANPLAGTVRKVQTPLGRGIEPPALLKQQPKTYSFRLQPKSKIHAPVDVWGYRTEHGWTGWLESFRRTQLNPTHWSADLWFELEPAQTKTSAGK